MTAPRSRGRAIALLATVFVVGLLVGAGVAAVADIGPGSEHRERGRAGFVQHLTERLDLTPAQQESVRTVLARHQPAMDSLWGRCRPRFDSLQTQIRAEIRAQLTPDQQSEFTEMTKRFDAKRRRKDSLDAVR